MVHTVSCGTHDVAVWGGEVICAPELGGCGRVYRLREAPEHCVCGEPMKGGGAILPICPQCFEELDAQLDKDAN